MFPHLRHSIYLRPPSGCLQYHTALSGRFTTFNFSPGAGAATTHLADQRYSVCVDRREGFCCVEYSLCAGVADAFTINNQDVAGTAAVDNNCNEDYIGIEGAIRDNYAMCAGPTSNP